jgi:TIR domain
LVADASAPDDRYVFISYSRDDGEYVERLVEWLRGNGVPVWYDRQVPNGVRWREVLAERIEHAAALLLVESASAQASKWVNEEFLYAEKKGHPLLVLVVDGDPRFGLMSVHAEFVVDGALPGESLLAQARTLLAATRADEVPATLPEAVLRYAPGTPPVGHPERA